MTQIAVTHGHFESETEALALAEATGFAAMALDLTPSGLDHWHDFGASVFVVQGSVRVTDVDTGESCELLPGSSLSAQPGVVHREEGELYRAVVAFDCDPSTLSMPIDKSPDDRPA